LDEKYFKNKPANTKARETTGYDDIIFIEDISPE
jgi:hypothetical protein